MCTHTTGDLPENTDPDSVGLGGVYNFVFLTSSQGMPISGSVDNTLRSKDLYIIFKLCVVTIKKFSNHFSHFESLKCPFFCAALKIHLADFTLLYNSYAVY